MLPKHLFVIQKLGSVRSTVFGFAQNSLHDFQNTVYELIVAMSSTNATKTFFAHFDQKRKCSVFTFVQYMYTQHIATKHNKYAASLFSLSP